MTHKVDTHCRAFQLAIDILGRPWTAVILNLLQEPLRFSEIGERAPGLEKWGRELVSAETS